MNKQLENAKNNREEARNKMNTAKVGSKAWREAEEELNFWQGKVAMLEIMADRNI